MKLPILGLCFFLISAQWSHAQEKKVMLPTGSSTSAAAEIINLSKEKWRWMSERKADTLATLFDEKAVFVHMGGTMTKDQELNVIKSGGIHYKHAEIQETSVQFIGATAVVLNKIQLVAVVGGNEVTNPFVVTEVYVRKGSAWKLGAMSFTRLLTSVSQKATTDSGLLMIQEQGSFAVGGKVITAPGTFDPYKPTVDGQTYHGDHAYVFYQIPPKARKYPLVLWHGAGQFSKTWGTTADGREGYQNIFLRRGFSVYSLDQPRRGSAGRSMVEATVKPTPDEQFWFGMFRIGTGTEYFPGVQFAKDPETLNQYFRSMTPNTGPFDVAVITDAVSALFEKIGTGILVTHSQSGGPGWVTAIKNANIKAIVSYEPGSNFVFPQGDVPPVMQSAAGPLEAVGIPKEDFLKLTKIPIIIYYGDNIPATPTNNPGTDNWRVRLAMARLFCDAINKYGGDATLVHLPEIGIKGNTHFPFSDLNNAVIADLMSEWLKEKKLD